MRLVENSLPQVGCIQAAFVRYQPRLANILILACSRMCEKVTFLQARPPVGEEGEEVGCADVVVVVEVPGAEGMAKVPLAQGSSTRNRDHRSRLDCLCPMFLFLTRSCRHRRIFDLARGGLVRSGFPRCLRQSVWRLMSARPGSPEVCSYYRRCHLGRLRTWPRLWPRHVRAG